VTISSLSTRLVGAVVLLFAWTSTPATGQMAPIPDDDSARRYRPHTQALPASDLSLLERAFDYADRKQWDQAIQVAAQISNTAARDVVYWRAYTSKDNGIAFTELDRFFASHREWPNQRGLQARVEEAMPADSMQPDQVIGWFQGREPVSGEGMVKLGDAYVRKAQDANGKAWLRRGWIEGNFSVERMTYIASRYNATLTADDHKRRASRLVWAGEYGQANAMQNWLDKDVENLVTARIKLRQSARDADAAYSRVTTSLQNDSGLLFDRARWLRKRDRDAEARPLLINAAANLDGPPPATEEWWTERNYQAREALDDGNTQQAYQVAATHGMRKDAGVPYAEAEFLAGWISLRYLNKPEPAYDHFLRLREGVTAPISIARAHYWAGRAAEKAGRATEAQRQFGIAAGYPQTYYGQIAASVTNPRGTLNLPLTRTSSTAKASNESVMQAMQALADVGAEGLLRTFALASADMFTEREQFVALSTFLRQLNQPALALRVAKRGLQKNLPVYDIAYPTLSLPVYGGNGTAPESALVLGFTRQESEFDPEALSSAGARGLMQMMPATAKLTARQHGLPYSDKRDLFTPTTNVRLGMAHVSDLLENFGGSYVLSIASYNAGQGRINQWISTYGDPRATDADMIDWVERIPFSETRNYVQRVLENTQIYRNVLAGRDVPLAITADLKRGAYTAVASASAQFSSSPAPAATPATAPAIATPATAPPPAATPAPTVVSSKPVYDDEDEVEAPKKSTKKASTKKKKRSSATASNGKKCKGSSSKNCRKRST
jgi:soluble lytic murein transglycosylase